MTYLVGYIAGIAILIIRFIVIWLSFAVLALSPLVVCMYCYFSFKRKFDRKNYKSFLERLLDVYWDRKDIKEKHYKVNRKEKPTIAQRIQQKREYWSK